MFLHRKSIFLQQFDFEFQKKVETAKKRKYFVLFDFELKIFPQNTHTPLTHIFQNFPKCQKMIVKPRLLPKNVFWQQVKNTGDV